MCACVRVCVCDASSLCCVCISIYRYYVYTICIYIYIYIHTYIHTYILIYTYIYIYIYMYLFIYVFIIFSFLFLFFNVFIWIFMYLFVYLCVSLFIHICHFLTPVFREQDPAWTNLSCLPLCTKEDYMSPSARKLSSVLGARAGVPVKPARTVRVAECCTEGIRIPNPKPDFHVRSEVMRKRCTNPKNLRTGPETPWLRKSKGRRASLTSGPSQKPCAPRPKRSHAHTPAHPDPQTLNPKP